TMGFSRAPGRLTHADGYVCAIPESSEFPCDSTPVPRSAGRGLRGKAASCGINRCFRSQAANEFPPELFSRFNFENWIRFRDYPLLCSQTEGGTGFGGRRGNIGAAGGQAGELTLGDLGCRGRLALDVVRARPTTWSRLAFFGPELRSRQCRDRG